MSPVRRRRAGWASPGCGGRGAFLPAPGARGTAGRTRRPTSPACRGGNTRDWHVPESAAAQRRVLPASPPLGFFLDDGHGDADQAVELLGAGLGQEAFAPGALAPAERIEQAPEEGEQRDALQLHVPEEIARLVLALGQALVAVGVAQALRGEGGND